MLVSGASLLPRHGCTPCLLILRARIRANAQRWIHGITASASGGVGQNGCSLETSQPSVWFPTPGMRDVAATADRLSDTTSRPGGSPARGTQTPTPVGKSARYPRIAVG